MFDTSLIADEVATAWLSIPALVAVMGDNITVHRFVYGDDFRLKEAIYKMTPPGILIAPELGPFGGNFDGMTIWKHRLHVFVRMANSAQTPAAPSYSAIWNLMLNRPVYGGTLNIRVIRLPIVNDAGEDVVDPMDHPPAPSVQQDEDGMDFLQGSLVFPELGDN